MSASLRFPRPRPRDRHRLLLVVALTTVGLVAGGCDTLGSDVGNVFADIAPPSPRQAAEWALDPWDAENRRRGTTLLANAPWGGSDVYVTMYRDRVENETDAQVLAISIRALARWGTVDDAPAIATHLTHRSREVRWEAARGLQRLHNPAVIGALTARLVDVDETPDIRLESAVALGQYPADRSFQALASALDARELWLNVEAQRSLTLLTGEDFGLDRTAWLRWYDTASDPFANQQTFYFPTFSRPVRLTDHLVFWRPLNFETPAPPAGLRDDGARTTYGEDDESVAAPSTGPRSTYDDANADAASSD